MHSSRSACKSEKNIWNRHRKCNLTKRKQKRCLSTTHPRGVSALRLRQHKWILRTKRIASNCMDKGSVLFFGSNKTSGFRWKTGSQSEMCYNLLLLSSNFYTRLHPRSADKCGKTMLVSLSRLAVFFILPICSAFLCFESFVQKICQWSGNRWS